MKKLHLLAVICIVAASLTGCVKKDHAVPPDLTGTDPDVTVTNSIASLLVMNGSYGSGNKDDTMLITQDIVIAGTVVANDRSGNFYKAIVIEDSTAGLQVLVDAYSLYADYPVGRRVFINCKGLYLGYDGGTPVLGALVNTQRGVDAMQGTSIQSHILKGSIGHAVAADTLDLADVSTFDAQYLNRLICIREAQFQDATTTYSDATATSNRYIENCDNGSLVVRTSNYADFHANQLPSGKGFITGIYTVYQSATGSSKTAQLLLRDTTDVKMYAPRCGAPTGGITLLSETFESIATTGNLALLNWKNVSESGNIFYKGGTYNNNKYASVSAYSTSQTSVKSWLVTPAVNLSGAVNPQLQFQTAANFDNGAALQVRVSTNYTGNITPWTATWTTLPATYSQGSSGFASDFTNSGAIDLSAFVGSNIYVAFFYQGTDPTGTASDQTTSFQLDNVYITSN